MTVHLVVGLGVAMWGLVFLLLLGAMAMEADVERRWNEAWAEQWEQAHGGSIDALIGRLARQVGRWRLGRRSRVRSTPSPSRASSAQGPWVPGGARGYAIPSG